MVKGESVNAEQVLEDIERRRQLVACGVFLGVIVPLAVFCIFVIL